MGVAKTVDLVQQRFVVPNLRERVRDMIKVCDVCQRVKSANPQRKFFAQRPIPSVKWGTVYVDFIEGLPPTKEGFSAIMCVVNGATRLAHLIPQRAERTAESVAWDFTREVVRLHGLPAVLHCDRDLHKCWGSIGICGYNQLVVILLSPMC